MFWKKVFWTEKSLNHWAHINIMENMRISKISIYDFGDWILFQASKIGPVSKRRELFESTHYIVIFLTPLISVMLILILFGPFYMLSGSQKLSKFSLCNTNLKLKSKKMLNELDGKMGLCCSDFETSFLK